MGFTCNACSKSCGGRLSGGAGHGSPASRLDGVVFRQERAVCGNKSVAISEGTCSAAPQCTGGFFILWETPASVRVSAEPNVCQTGWNLTSPGHRWQQRCRVCSGEGQLRPCRGAPVAGTQSSQRCTPAGFWAQVQDAPQQSCTHERPGTPLAAGCASAGPRGQREVPPRLRRKGVRSRNNDVGVLNFLNAALS